MLYNAKKRSNENGSVLTFSVIAFVLAALLVGTLYIVHNRGEQARREQAIAAAEQASQKEQNKEAGAADSGSTRSSEESTTATGTTQAELPATGPVSTVVSVLGLGLVTFMAISYYMSRRMIQRTL